MTDSEALRGLIESKGLKMKFVASRLGLSPYGFQLKVDNKKEFKSSEISILCEVLDIKSLTAKEKIFFTPKVDLKTTKKINQTEGS